MDFDFKKVLIWAAAILVVVFVISNIFNIIAFFAKVAIVLVPLFLVSRLLKLQFDIAGILVWVVGGILLWVYVAPPILALAAWLTPVLVVLGVIYVVVVALDYFGNETIR